jgi:hypothetical protein
MSNAVSILCLKLPIIEVVNFPSDIVRLKSTKICIIGHHILARFDRDTLRPSELKESWAYLTEDTLQDFIKAEESVKVTVGIDGLSVEAIDGEERS